MNVARIVLVGAACLTFASVACQDASVVVPEITEPSTTIVVEGGLADRRSDPRSPAPRAEAPPWARPTAPPATDAASAVLPEGAPSAGSDAFAANVGENAPQREPLPSTTNGAGAGPHGSTQGTRETSENAGFIGPLAQVPAPIVPYASAPASFADLVERVQPAVVNVYTEQIVSQRQLMIDPVYGPYAVTRPKKASSLGSGFIIDHDGYILTNTHVVQGAQSIRISLSDGREFPATIVGTDPQTDIALIRVDPFDGMVVLPIGDAHTVRVGDWLMAVGNPFGLQSTVTVGILSGRGRRDVPVGSGVRYVDFLQTDAAINPGNSGGPLIAMDGTVVGINTAMNAAGQGIGFAVPINMAAKILSDLRQHGTVARSWLGVGLEPVAVIGQSGQRMAGAKVFSVVAGGPGEKAGLQVGDIIIQFGEHAITSSGELPWLASTAGVGRVVDLRVLRDGYEYEVPVTMGALPN